MNSISTRFKVFALALLLLPVQTVITSAAALAQDEYVVRDLGRIVDSQRYAIEVTDLNDARSVAGFYQGGAATIQGQSFLIPDLAAQASFLPKLSSASINAAMGVNSSGAVVGYGGLPCAGQQGWRYQLGQTQSLAALTSTAPSCRPFSDFSNTVLSAINDQGQMAGYHAPTCRGASEAFISSGGCIKRLPKLPKGDSAVAFDINNRGQVVGYSTTVPLSRKVRHAFIYDQGKIKELTKLEKDVELLFYAALSINENSQIVGVVSRSESTTACTPLALWEQRDDDWSVTTLPFQTDDWTWQRPRINNNGTIVGGSRNCGGPYLWSRNSPHALNTLIPKEWTIDRVGGINDSGEIAAVGSNTGDNDYHALLLIPKNLDQSNHSPVLAPIGNKTISEGQPLEFFVSASDIDHDTLQFSAENLPSGARFHSEMQSFSWTPTYNQAGVYRWARFNVGDGERGDFEDVVITVLNKNRPPVLSPIKDVSLKEGQYVDITLSAQDPDLDALTFSVSPLPKGATLKNRRFYWPVSYTQAGTHILKFSASDGKLSHSRSIKITVANVPQPPTFDLIEQKKVIAGQKLTFEISATDPDAQPLTYTVSTLPTWAKFDSRTRIFSWTPGSEQIGSWRVTFTASDGKFKTSKIVPISVESSGSKPEGPIISNPPLFSWKTVMAVKTVRFELFKKGKKKPIIKEKLDRVGFAPKHKLKRGSYKWRISWKKKGKTLSYPFVFFEIVKKKKG